MIKVFDTSDIIRLAKAGLSASSIKRELSLNISVRQVQRIVSAKLGAARREKVGRIDGDHLGSGALRSIIEQLMIERGHNIKICDLCRLPQYKPCDIHHLKYEGATIEDLVFACRKCNLKAENVGLS